MYILIRKHTLCVWCIVQSSSTSHIPKPNFQSNMYHCIHVHVHVYARNYLESVIYRRRLDYMYMYIYCIYVGSFFLGKVTALGVLCCFALFVCLTLLASFFLPSHLSFKNMYMYIYMYHASDSNTISSCILKQ